MALKVYLIQHYVMKLVSDLRQVCGFLWFPTAIKIDRHDITEILLKVVLNTKTITLSLTNSSKIFKDFCHNVHCGSRSKLVSSTNKTDCRDIAEILLKVALNTLNP